jgi:hypothetical protein
MDVEVIGAVLAFYFLTSVYPNDYIDFQPYAHISATDVFIEVNSRA